MTAAFPGTGSQEQDQHGWSQEIPKIYHIFYRVRKCLEKYNTFFHRVRKFLNITHFYRVTKFLDIKQLLPSPEIPKYNRFLTSCQEIPEFNTFLQSPEIPHILNVLYCIVGKI
jgi:hypothetical protein